MYGLSDFTKSLAVGIATVSEPSLMSQVGSVYIVQCVSAIGVVKVPVSVRTRSCSNGTLVARIRVGCCQVIHAILDDPCCLSSVAAGSGWAEMDSWPLVHGGCYHMTEVG